MNALKSLSDISMYADQRCGAYQASRDPSLSTVQPIPASITPDGCYFVTAENGIQSQLSLVGSIVCGLDAAATEALSVDLIECSSLRSMIRVR